MQVRLIINMPFVAILSYLPAILLTLASIVVVWCVKRAGRPGF